jgi:hypothetical protein
MHVYRSKNLFRYMRKTIIQYYIISFLSLYFKALSKKKRDKAPKKELPYIAYSTGVLLNSTKEYFVKRGILYEGWRSMYIKNKPIKDLRSIRHNLK